MATSPTVQLIKDVRQLLVDVAAMAASRIVYDTAYRETVAVPTNLITTAYNPNQVTVFLNGSLMDPGDDYNATNGSTVDFTFQLQAGDRVVVHKIKIDTAGQATWQAALDLKQNKEVSSGPTAVLTTATVDMNGPAHQWLTLQSPACAITVTTTAVPAGEARIVHLLLKQGTGANGFNFGTSVTWVNGTAPVPSYDINMIDSIRLKFVPGLTKPIAYYEGGWISG